MLGRRGNWFSMIRLSVMKGSLQLSFAMAAVLVGRNTNRELFAKVKSVAHPL